MKLWSRAKWSHFLVALLLLFLILIPFDWFLGHYTSLMIFIGLHTMITVGLCLLMGYTGQVSLGQAAFYGTGAYFSAILTTTYGFNPWFAMLLAAVATGLFAYLIGYPIFRLRGNYLAMATLALGIVVAILFSELEQFTNGPTGISNIPQLSIAGFVFDTALKKYFLIWGFCLAALLISQNIVRSRAGRALRAIHGSEAAAESIGVNATQFKIKIFVMSAVLASLAGSLFAHHLSYVNPQPFGFTFSVIVVVMAVVGGLASIWGAIFGAATVRILSGELLLGFGNWDVVVYGAILIVVMIFTPEGLFVGMRNLFERLRIRLAARGTAS